MEAEEQSLVDMIRSVVEGLKKKPLTGNWRQTIDNYVFDKDVDIRLTISVHQKPASEYERMMNVFEGR